jgi:uncharacterized protein YbjT (DUF2867 family)
LDDPAASSFHAEPSSARLHHQRRGGVLASGDGKIPYVDLRDVAAVAFVTLSQPGHLDKTYVVTGSEALSYREAAEIISAEIGKPLRFVDETQVEARERRIREGLPPAVIESALRSPPISGPAGRQ